MSDTHIERIPAPWAARAEAVQEADTERFDHLFALSGLDPKRHLRLANCSGVDFSGSDLRGFDLSGANLRNCNFDGSLVEGARFDQAEINGTDLRTARDWDAHLRAWQPSSLRVRDRYLPDGAVFQDAPFAPELVVVPSGRFMMGSPEDEEGRFDDEGPRHEVTIPERLAVGHYAVTFDEWDFANEAEDWQRVTGLEPRRPNDRDWGRDRRPVIDVSWEDAQSYIAWLRRKTGHDYRLLSEAEWEYCCRAVSKTRYSFGDDVERLRDSGWYGENSGNTDQN
jgi:formylglycine-generating enzyme required for sulfatase activity